MRMLLAASLGLVIAMSWTHYVRAQTPASIVQFDTMQGPVSGCQTHAGVSTLCLGTDGFVFSAKGAAYGPNLAIPTPVQGTVTGVAINGITKQGPVPSFTLTTPSTVNAQ